MNWFRIQYFFFLSSSFPCSSCRILFIFKSIVLYVFRPNIKSKYMRVYAWHKCKTQLNILSIEPSTPNPIQSKPNQIDLYNIMKSLYTITSMSIHGFLLWWKWKQEELMANEGEKKNIHKQKKLKYKIENTKSQNRQDPIDLKSARRENGTVKGKKWERTRWWVQFKNIKNQ